MEYVWTKLPLFNSWDYEYTVTLADVNYTIRLYYNDRMQKWAIDLSYEDGDPIVLGEALLPYKRVVDGKFSTEIGFLWLEAISLDDNETFLHPSLLSKYFNFYFIGV